MSFCSMAMGLFLFKFLVIICPSTKKILSFAWLSLQFWQAIWWTNQQAAHVWSTFWACHLRLHGQYLEFIKLVFAGSTWWGVAQCTWHVICHMHCKVHPSSFTRSSFSCLR
jgi:hypothetical protein